MFRILPTVFRHFFLQETKTKIDESAIRRHRNQSGESKRGNEKLTSFTKQTLTQTDLSLMNQTAA